MAETTTSGNDFQLHEGLKDVITASTNADTYTIHLGSESWSFQNTLGEEAHFGNYLASFVKAVYQAGLRSSGNPTELGEAEDDAIKVTPNEETLALAGNCSPSIVPGTHFQELVDNPPPVAPYTPEFPASPGNSAGGGSTSSSEAPPAPIHLG